mmetsp:Transcript_120856/g.324427  ORF Transcript_120856/g.324427 Transcript_120856/m.324427 type:complete len:207 (+) Transcript_120856:236-856(+)
MPAASALVALRCTSPWSTGLRGSWRRRSCLPRRASAPCLSLRQLGRSSPPSQPTTTRAPAPILQRRPPECPRPPPCPRRPLPLGRWGLRCCHRRRIFRRAPGCRSVTTRSWCGARWAWAASGRSGRRSSPARPGRRCWPSRRSSALRRRTSSTRCSRGTCSARSVTLAGPRRTRPLRWWPPGRCCPRWSPARRGRWGPRSGACVSR